MTPLEMLEKHMWIPLAAFVIGAILRAVKAGWWPADLYIAPKYRPWIVFALGWVSGSLDVIVTGKPLWEGFAGGLLSSLMSIGGHELFIESLRGGRELMSAKK